MKTILVFDNEQPDDMTICKKMLQVNDWIAVVDRVAETIRRDLKYGNGYNTPDEALESLRALISDEMEDRQLSLY